MSGGLRTLLLTALVAFATLAAERAGAATIVVNNLDGPGEGFNDATPRSPEGGNPGMTLGALRLNAFNEAADRWEAIISSSVTIQANGNFNPLMPCGMGGALLGSAGPNSTHRDFAGAPLPATWYSQAQANALAGFDLNGGSADLSATFNTSIDAGCLPGTTGWYYGFDGNPPPGKIDLVPVLLHEFAHGLGFLTFVNLSTGAKLLGFDDIFMTFLENHSTGLTYPAMSNAQRIAASTATGNLHWVGPNVAAMSALLASGTVGTHVRMYAPSTPASGSSVSHWDTALAPNELMEPFDTGTSFQLLTEAAFTDMGYALLPHTTPTSTATPTPTVTTTPTPTLTATRTATITPTPTVTATASATATPTAHPTCTVDPVPGPTATPVTTNALKCKRAIAKNATKFYAAKTKYLQRCAATVLKTGSGTCPDAAASAKIASAAAKLAIAIGKTCGGADRLCGGDLTDEEPPAGLGWPAACPNFENDADPACSAPLTDCGDVASCIECIGEAAVDQAIALYYDSLTPSAPGTVLNRCQDTIGRASARFILAREKAIAKCWDARLAGKHSGVCPDANAPAGSPPQKAIATIAKAETKAIVAMCKACGGNDQKCDQAVTTLHGPPIAGSGSNDDLTPATIGFLPTCPLVKVPDGVFCDQPVATLADLVECVDCVSAFKVGCMDRARVPGFEPYPCECNP
jgi:hypothetical protein